MILEDLNHVNHKLVDKVIYVHFVHSGENMISYWSPPQNVNSEFRSTLLPSAGSYKSNRDHNIDCEKLCNFFF